jgi:hypothetical protein
MTYELPITTTFEQSLGISPMQHLVMATNIWATEANRRENFKKYNVTEELYDAYLKKTSKDKLGVAIK